MVISRDLLSAYRNTRYGVRTPLGEIALRIDAPSPSPPLDALLRAAGCQIWVFISADNPGSVADPTGNPARRARLLADVEALGLPGFAGRGIADDALWPAEESLLVLGLSEDDGTALGRKYGQIAVLAGALGGPARLVACDDKAPP